jgi:hypothetical protein
MPKSTPSPACPKCSKPMRWMLVKSGGRKYRCIDCEGPDPMHAVETTGWLKGELGERVQK